MSKDRRQDSDDILTINQVANYLQLHMMTIYRLIRNTNMPFFRVGNAWRVRKVDLDAWMDERYTIPTN